MTLAGLTGRVRRLLSSHEESRHVRQPTTFAEWFGFDRMDPAARDRLANAVEGSDDQRFVAGLLEDVLDKATKLLVNELRRTRAGVVAANRRDRQGFEGRLRENWGPALDLYDAVWMATTEIGGDLSDRMTAAAGREEKDPVFHAMKLLHGRACVVASEVRALLASGHPSGAEARARTLHEIAVVIYVIHHGGDELAERYLLHRHVAALRDAEAYQKAVPLLQDRGAGYEPMTIEEMAQLHRTHGELISRYGAEYSKDWGWAAPLNGGRGPQFVTLERLAGLQHLRPFVRLAHHRVHATARGAELNLVRRGRANIMLAGATNAGLSDPGQSALISLHQSTTALLIYGCMQLEDPMLLISAKALQALVEDACVAFAKAEERISQKEATLWENEQDG